MAVTLVLSGPGLAQQCPNLVWSDEFDGTAVDTNKWEFQIGDGCDIGLCGWGNNEEEYYKAENATVSGGTLKIEAKRERVRSKAYTSARMRTLNKGEWTFGRFEARIKMTTGQGIWPAFWMLPTDEIYGGWPQSGEIDIMENIGSEPSTVHGTIHFGDPFPDNRSSGASFNLASGAFADDFYEFAIEKEAGEIRWYLNDVLYSVKTPADTAPNTWPFDERFHFILNVAVGGNWPGSPGSSTVFPQVLEVDYVRVYDGNLPSLSGDNLVDHMESGVTYQVDNLPSGSSVSWTVPAGATIVSGQGSSTITVDWGAAGGTVTATPSNDCGNGPVQIEVTVDPPFVLESSFENFDSPAQLTFSSATGTLQEINNPDTSGVNSSASAGEYTRNAGEQFDVLVYSTSAIPDASVFVDRLKKFSIDVLTSAPVGSVVLLQLEDSSQATPSNFPTGRHSRFQAQTTTQGQWERLEIPFLDRPDGSVPDSAVDTVIFLFAPNSLTGDTYTWDNFDRYAIDGGTGGHPPAAPSGLTANAASSSAIDLTWNDNSGDEDSFEIDRSMDGSNFSLLAMVGENTTSYSDSGLAASTTYHYRVRAVNANGASGDSNTASATTSGGGTATSIHVDSIVVGTQNAGQGNKRGTATVTLVDDQGQPVDGASVTGTFTGDFNETVNGTTASDGTVTLVTIGVKKGSITFTFCVDQVTGSLPYDAASNVVTCGAL